MKERFIMRYKIAIRLYFEYKGHGEGKRALLYVMQEYRGILKEEFGMTEKEVKDIYDEEYAEANFR